MRKKFIFNYLRNEHCLYETKNPINLTLILFFIIKFKVSLLQKYTDAPF